MSKTKVIPDYKCPHCGKEFDVTIYESINSQISPELREKVLNGTIFDYVCPHCGKKLNLPYSFLYHDMNSKSMIHYNDFANLLMTYEHEIKKLSEDENSPMNMFGEIFDEYHYMGAIDLPDLVTAIICAENNLNWKVAWLVTYKVAQDFVDNEKDEKYQSTQKIGLKYNDKKEIEIIIIAGKDGAEPKVITNRFPQNIYNEYLEKYEKDLEHTYEFIFNEESAEKFLKEVNVEQPKYNKNTKLCVLDNPDGSLCPYPAILPSYNAFNKGDIVNIYYDGSSVVRRIIEIIDFSNRALPVIPTKTPIILSKAYTFEPKDTKKSLDSVNNSKIISMLNEYIESNYQYKKFPFELLYDANVIIGYSHTKKIPIDELTDIKNKEVKAEDDIKIDTIKNKHGSIFLNVYLTKEAADKADNSIKKIVVKFTDAVELVRSVPDYFDAILFRTNDEIDKQVTFNHYMCNRIYVDTLMGISTNMIGLLNSFTKEEIGYMSLDEYGDTINLIKKFYPADKSPKEVAREMNLPEERVHKLLDYGYEKMQDVVHSNYTKI